MKIGIDISQAAYEGTGVANFLINLIEELTKKPDIDLVLFYSSLGNYSKTLPFSVKAKVRLKRFPFPPWILDILWNRWHIIPIERFIGSVDVFISSDWTQPPVSSGKSATILYDLIIYKFPRETDAGIVAVQKRKISWSKQECDLLICISEATRKDAIEILGIPEQKLKVVHPGM
ncbi:MAG: glycosyltransferase [Candidatus Levybacteria bacterium]|nr:glycosyltransferase [Candidatus Levybacteria bacterium]